jgi:hypothetical protein
MFAVSTKSTELRKHKLRRLEVACRRSVSSFKVCKTKIGTWSWVESLLNTHVDLNTNREPATFCFCHRRGALGGWGRIFEFYRKKRNLTALGQLFHSVN